MPKNGVQEEKTKNNWGKNKVNKLKWRNGLGFEFLIIFCYVNTFSIKNSHIETSKQASNIP